MINRVRDCDILSLREVYKYKELIPSLHTSWVVKLDDGNIAWWWEDGDTVGRAVRPCLRVEDCDLPIGANVNWFGLTWKHLGDGIILCEYAIHYFSETCNYEMIKDWLKMWYESR